MPTDSPFLKLADERVLILDGAMGTSLHRYKPTDADWGYSPAGKSLMNLSDALVYTKPDWIREIHAGYFEAGCDAVDVAPHRLRTSTGEARLKPCARCAARCPVTDGV